MFNNFNETELRNQIYQNPSFKKLTVQERKEQADLNVTLFKIDPVQLFNFARKQMIQMLAEQKKSISEISEKINTDERMISLLYENSQEYKGMVFTINKGKKK